MGESLTEYRNYQNCFLSISLFPPLTQNVSMHLLRIYGRFRPFLTYNIIDLNTSFKQRLFSYTIVSNVLFYFSLLP